MTSLGAPNVEHWTPQRICDEWIDALRGLDAIHHQAGNYIIDINGSTANAKVYAITSHYKQVTLNGHIREFVGSYDFHFTKTGKAWKLDEFKFNLKYMTGNVELD